MANAKDTIKQIKELDSIESIKNLIKGDERKSVLDFAKKRISKLSEDNNTYFDDVQPKDETEKVYPVGSDLGRIHDVK